jgi:hypothetical protein
MHPTDKAARVAGAVYLSMALFAPFSLIYIPRTLIVRGNATVTANNILAHEALFRLLGELRGGFRRVRRSRNLNRFSRITTPSPKRNRSRSPTAIAGTSCRGRSGWRRSIRRSRWWR